jgi:adenine-specific DNA glycosylase
VREGLSISVRSGGLIGEVGHAFTHVRVTYRAVRCRHPEGEGAPLRYEQWMWASPRQLDELPMGVAQRKIAALSLEPTIFPG